MRGRPYVPNKKTIPEKAMQKVSNLIKPTPQKTIKEMQEKITEIIAQERRQKLV